jgi:hypothetical protein
MGKCDGQKRATQDGRMAAVKQSRHAVSGREGCDWRRTPRWKRSTAGGWRSGCTYGGHMRAAIGKGNVAVSFIFWRNHERRRPIGPDHWASSGTSRPDGTRLDRHLVPALSLFNCHSSSSSTTY